MIKKLLVVAMAVLALNFLAVAGGLGFLWQSQKLDKDKLAKIREIVFAPASQPATQPAADELTEATTQPSMKLEELLATKVGLSTSEQVQSLQSAFDEQMAVLERKSRELEDQKAQVEAARKKQLQDRMVIATAAADFKQKQDEAARLANDKGFADTLTLYNSMAPKQVKTIFASLDDDTVVRFLSAMQPRTAAKIVKEFKSPEEATRIQRVMERMRQYPAVAPGASAAVPTSK